MALLPPATKLGQGYIFTGICDSVHGGGGGVCPSACGVPPPHSKADPPWQGRPCRGITRIHRLPPRPSHPYGRQPHSLIFMSTLYKASSRLPAKQLTSDHEPACMCHLYRLRINTHVLTNTMHCVIVRHGDSSD